MTRDYIDVKRVIEMQREFSQMYHETGLTALESDYVQVNPECLAELADPATWNVMAKHADSVFAAEAKITIDGVDFIAVMSHEEAERFGVTVPEGDTMTKTATVDQNYNIVPEAQWCPKCNESRCDRLIIDDDSVHCTSCGEVYDL